MLGAFSSLPGCSGFAVEGESVHVCAGGGGGDEEYEGSYEADEGGAGE